MIEVAVWDSDGVGFDGTGGGLRGVPGQRPVVEQQRIVGENRATPDFLSPAEELEFYQRQCRPEGFLPIGPTRPEELSELVGSTLFTSATVSRVVTGPDPGPDPGTSTDVGADTGAESNHGGLDRLVMALHDRLTVTATRPVYEDTGRRLGEAEAAAGDLMVGSFPDEEVVRTRLGRVEHLLSNVDRTGDEATDEHVASTRVVLADALAILGDGSKGDE